MAFFFNVNYKNARVGNFFDIKNLQKYVEDICSHFSRPARLWEDQKSKNIFSGFNMYVSTF